MPEGAATRERFGPLVLGGLLKVCNVRRVLDQARVVLALPAWDVTNQPSQGQGLGSRSGSGGGSGLNTAAAGIGVQQPPVSARERAKARRMKLGTAN